MDKVLHRGSGCNLLWIAKAAKLAKRFGPDVKLLAERPSRVLRSRYFHPWISPECRPTEDELAELQLALNGVQLMTVLTPAASPEEDASYRAERGQRTTGRSGGGDRNPGYKNRIRQKLKICVQELYEPLSGVRPLAIREIASMVELPKSTVNRWTKDELPAVR